MSSNQRNILRRSLERQNGRIQQKIDILSKWHGRISKLRLALFITGIIVIYVTVQTGNSTIAGLAFILFFGSFFWLASRHQKLEQQQERFSIWKKIRQTHLARMELDWEKIPDPGFENDTKDHPFASDLNITGRHSLLHLLDTSIYEGGKKQLQSWLLHNAPDISKINTRQQLVEELKPMAYFRDQLQLRAAVSRSYESDDDWDMSTLLTWLQHSTTKRYSRELFILGGLALSNWILGILYLAGWLPPYVIFTFLLYLVLYSLNSEKIKGAFDSAYQIEKLLSRFSTILIYLEEFPYKKGSNLEEFCSLYHKSGGRPSRFLKKIIRLAAAIALQKNDFIRGIINLMVPWDLFFSHQLNKYKSELKDPLKNWLNRFYQLEALCSLANFAWLNPGYILAKPEEQRTEPVLQAKQLGHPLIPYDQKVCNDVTIQNAGNVLLITGSNMSGKSTFLRTLGINICLCLSGGPVNAEVFRTIPFRLFSSLNVTDSLDRGFSHFYAEVRKLRFLLNELERKDTWPLFFLVDEIFRGTNNRERLIGSRAFLRHVAGKDGVGVVSTHDLELASLENEIPQLGNWHFEETIENGKMSFEYKLKPGPCPTTNALKIMEMEGLPISEE